MKESQLDNILFFLFVVFVLLNGWNLDQKNKSIATLNKELSNIRKQKTFDSLMHLMYVNAVMEEKKEREEAEQEIIDNYNN